MDTNNNNNDLRQCTCTGQRSCGKTQKAINDLLKRISNLEFEVEDLEKYKVRCEKAIKYINGDNLSSGVYRYAEDFDFDKLLNILRGSDAN